MPCLCQRSPALVRHSTFLRSRSIAPVANLFQRQHGGRRPTCFRPWTGQMAAWRRYQVVPPQAPSVHPKSSCHAIAQTPGEQLRSLMRLMTHSVVVCTSCLPAMAGPYTVGPYTVATTLSSQPQLQKHTGIHGPVDQDKAQARRAQDANTKSTSGSHVYDRVMPRAMTMSSFTSLALAPVPIVTFNVAVPSRTLDAVAASHRFNIHILSGDSSGAAVAERFAGGNAEDGTLESDERCRVLWSGTATEGVQSSDSPPILHGEGILYVLRCRLLTDRGEAVDTAAREEALIRVQDHVIVLGEVLEIIEGEGSTTSKIPTFALAYSDRQYRMLGNVLNRRSD